MNEHEAPSSAASSPDPGATSTTAEQPDLLRKVSAATDRAVDQHNAETKRRPGQRGPDKSPRKPKAGFSVGSVGDGARSPLSAPTAAVDDPPLWDPIPPAVDEETAKAFASAFIEMFNDGRANLNRFLAYRITGDAMIAERNVPQTSEGLRKSLDHAALLVSRKWLAKIQLEPEYLLAGTMGGLIFQDYLRYKMLAREAAKLQQQQPAAA